MLAGFGVFSMRHKDIWGVAESFLEFFHVNPYHHYVGVFIDLVYRLSDVRLWKIAVVASIYVSFASSRRTDCGTSGPGRNGWP